MALKLHAGVADAIRQHGIETYPNECCGALFGREGEVSATFALPNTTDEGPRRRFLVRPQDYREAERRAAELRGRVARVLPLAPGPSGPAVAVPISTMRGRYFRTSSFPSVQASQKT